MTDTHDPVLAHLADGGTPFVLIRSTGIPGFEDFDLDVKAGCGIDDRDQLTALLLLTVEQMTGVSTSLYVQEVEIARAAARGAR
jgi:hypothetical protein